MKDIYYYQPTKVSDLSSSLAKVFENMEADGNRYIKSATVNTILAVWADYDKKEVEDLIDSLTMVHPNRAFLIVLDESTPELKSEFSTRCYKISKTEHVCSEVIRLICPVSKFPEIKSILRANLITGMQTELVLYYEKGAKEIYKQLEGLSDQILYSSSIFQKNFADLQLLAENGQALIDLEWVKLGIWRDQVKEAFQNSFAKEKLSELKSIQISYSDENCQAYLIAGWIADRLSMHLKSKNNGKFILASKEGREINLELNSGVKFDISGINEINFVFKNSSEYIKIYRKEQLHTEINFEEKFRTTRPIENLNFIELLKRYFFIGESTINYRDSLKLSLKLFS